MAERNSSDSLAESRSSHRSHLEVGRQLIVGQHRKPWKSLRDEVAKRPADVSRSEQGPRTRRRRERRFHGCEQRPDAVRSGRPRAAVDRVAEGRALRQGRGAAPRARAPAAAAVRCGGRATFDRRRRGPAPPPRKAPRAGPPGWGARGGSRPPPRGAGAAPRLSPRVKHAAPPRGPAPGRRARARRAGPAPPGRRGAGGPPCGAPRGPRRAPGRPGRAPGRAPRREPRSPTATTEASAPVSGWRACAAGIPASRSSSAGARQSDQPAATCPLAAGAPSTSRRQAPGPERPARTAIRPAGTPMEVQRSRRSAAAASPSQAEASSRPARRSGAISTATASIGARSRVRLPATAGAAPASGPRRMARIPVHESAAPRTRNGAAGNPGASPRAVRSAPAATSARGSARSSLATREETLRSSPATRVTAIPAATARRREGTCEARPSPTARSR